MNDLERRVRQLLDPYTGTGRSPRELLQHVYRRLVDRLFFGDFHVTEHSQLIGGREIAQIVATKAGRVIGPGLLCSTRMDDPRRLDHALPWNDDADMHGSVWSLLVFLTQLDVLASTSVDRFVRPVSLLLTSGPAWFEHEAIFDSLTSRSGTPEWALVSSPTRGSMAGETKGAISIRVWPSDGMKSRLRPRLAGQEVVRAEVAAAARDLLDPDGLLVGLLQTADISLHDMVFPQGGSCSMVLAGVDLSAKVPWALTPVPDGTAVGCDLRELLLTLQNGITGLAEASLDGRVCMVRPSDDIVEIELSVKFTHAPEDVMETIVDILTRDEMFHVAFEGVVPPYTPTTGGALYRCLDALECETAEQKPMITEAGIFAAQGIESFVLGPGTEANGGNVRVNTTQLDAYGQFFEELVERLVLDSPKS